MEESALKILSAILLIVTPTLAPEEASGSLEHNMLTETKSLPADALTYGLTKVLASRGRLLEATALQTMTVAQITFVGIKLQLMLVLDLLNECRSFLQKISLPSDGSLCTQIL